MLARCFIALTLVLALFVLSTVSQESNPNDSLNDPFTTPNCVPGTNALCVLPASLTGVTASGVANADTGDAVDGWGFVVAAGQTVIVTVTPIAPAVGGGGILQVVTRGTGANVGGVIVFGGAPLVVTVGAGDYLVSIQDFVGGTPLPYTYGFDAVPPSVSNDPHFAGLQGQSFLINGVSGNVYNLISTPNMQVNARFTHIDSALLDADSTWITDIALVLRTPNNASTPLQRVYVGVQRDGSFVMTLNDKHIEVASLAPDETASVRRAIVVVQTAVANTDSVKLVRTGAQDLVVMNSEFVLELNVDTAGHPQWCSEGCPHLDMNAYPAVSLERLEQVGAHGLFGQTWRKNPSAPGREVGSIEGEPAHYVVADGLWGTQFAHNRFDD